MEASELPELETVRNLVRAAALSDDVRRTIAWCLDRLPRLYTDFRRSYDTRHGDEIQRLVDAVLQSVAAAAGVRETVIDRLQAMHERFGLPALKFITPKPPPSRKRKAG